MCYDLCAFSKAIVFLVCVCMWHDYADSTLILTDTARFCTNFKLYTKISGRKSEPEIERRRRREGISSAKARIDTAHLWITVKLYIYIYVLTVPSRDHKLYHFIMLLFRHFLALFRLCWINYMTANWTDIEYIKMVFTLWAKCSK